MMKTITHVLAFGLIAPLSAEVIVQYGTAGGTTSLAPVFIRGVVTADDLVAGAGIDMQTYATFNFTNWDPVNTSFADAVEDEEKWTWGFTVVTAPVELTTMDIRLDRSGTGPDDFGIEVVVTPSGRVPGVPITVLTHDFADTSSGVDFRDVDLSGIPRLGAGDRVEFTLAAYNAEATGGTFDLELIDALGAGIVINASPLSLSVDPSTTTEGDGLLTATVTRSGGIDGALEVAITNPDPSELEMPAMVTIPDQAASGTFVITVKDDPDLDGTQVVTLEVSADGLAPGDFEVTVKDDEMAPVLRYGTAGSTTSLAPAFVSSAVTADDLVAGDGIDVRAYATFNFTNWDPANTSFADAVADDEKWTWGFTVVTAPVELTTMDIRLDRSGTGPDDFGIEVVVTPSGGAPGVPLTLLTHDFADTDRGVDFLNVDLSAVPSLGAGDRVEFTLAAFNAEATGGTFDLEIVDDELEAGIVINAIRDDFVGWRDRHFGSGYPGDDADPDHDGIANLLEFMMNLDPLVADSHLGPRVRVENGEVVCSYPQIKTTNHDVIAYVTWSTALKTWTSGGVVYKVVEDLGDTVMIEARMIIPVEGELFMRVEALRMDAGRP